MAGAANVDLVARCARLPRRGETIGDAEFERVAGGKGANQAVAAARMGARTRFVGRIGADDLVLRSLEREGVDTSGVVRDRGESGVALILVEAGGENVIVVAPGANRRLTPEDVDVGEADAVICQQEIPGAAIAAAAADARFFCLNAAPARGPLELEPDLLVVNRYEYDAVGSYRGLVALTLGLAGRGVARGRPGGRAREATRRASDRRDRGRRCVLRRPGCLAARRRAPARALARACAAGARASRREWARSHRCRRAGEVDGIIAA